MRRPYAKCPHGKRKRYCRKCKGAGTCKHSSNKDYCRKCKGSRICEHGKQKGQCGECGGFDTIAHMLLRSAKHRAKKKKLPFNITLEDVRELLKARKCPVFGTRLKPGLKHSTDNSPSLDRMKPELGYTKRNVAVISWRANRIKCDATTKEITQLLKYMTHVQ